MCWAGRGTMGTKRGSMDLPVAALMSTRVVQLLSDTPMAEARLIMSRYDFHGFPVATPDGRLVGMLSKVELLRATSAGVRDSDVWRQPVSRWMATGAPTAESRDSVGIAIDRLVQSGVRSLPVIDVDGRVVGMVSRGDLVMALEDQASK